VGLALNLEDYHPSLLLHCRLGHLTCKIVSEMTYNVSSGTLNPTMQYSTSDRGVLLVYAAPGPNCQDNADWCSQLFPGQCYDHAVKDVCCATCSRYDTSQPGESFMRLFPLLYDCIPSVRPYCPLRTLVTIFYTKLILKTVGSHFWKQLLHCWNMHCLIILCSDARKLYLSLTFWRVYCVHHRLCVC